MVTLRLLGGIRLTDPSGEEIGSLLTQSKRMAVLVYLALQGKTGYLRRDVLMARFWAESDLSHARNALNQALHILRRELGEDVVLTRGRHEVGLNPARFECDVWVYKDALRAGRNEEALNLYEGPLMPGFHVNECGEFDRWLEEERETLRETAAKAAWTLAHHWVQMGELVEAERMAQRALALVWTDESPVRQFISVLAEAGERAAAVRFYEKFCLRLQEELELEPSSTTRRVAEAIRNGVETNLPAERADGGTTTQVSTEPGVAAGIDRTHDSSTLTPSGSEWTPKSPDSEANAGRRRGWWWTAAAGGAVVLTFALFRSAGSPDPMLAPPPDRPSTVLADVAGTGGEEERVVVAFLLRTGLDMSHLVQTVPEPDVGRTLTLMEVPGERPLDPALAREVGMRLGVATVVVSRLDRVGDTYSLVVRMEDAATGHLRAVTRRQTERVGGVVELVDSVVLDLRRQLGEARGILRNREPLPQVLTASLEALREYRLAREAGPGRARTAVRHLQRAVAADTAFAMAWQLMASFYGNYLNQPDSAEFALGQVQRFSHRLTEARRLDRELHRRIRIDVALWDVALEEGEEAMHRNARFLNNYSVYTGVPGGLLDSALNMRFTLEGDGAKNARRFNPDLPYEARCFINTHYLAAALDRMDEFYRLLDSMDIRMPPDCGREVALFESLAAAEWDRVDSLVRHSPGDWRWPTGVEAALLQTVPLRGGIRAAHAVPFLKRPETRGLRPDSSGFSNISHLLLQVAYKLPMGEAREKTFHRTGVPKVLASRGRDEVTDFVLYGVRESLLGDTVEAKRVARRLQAMRDSATSRTFEGAFEPWFALLDAGPAFQREDWQTVLEILAPVASRIHQPKVGSLPGDDYLIWWLLAEAHIQLDDPRSAIRELESILERPRHRRKNWMLQGFIRPAARFRLAGMYDGVGEAEGAREHYRAFLNTFTHPETDFQWMVEEARAALGGHS